MVSNGFNFIEGKWVQGQGEIIESKSPIDSSVIWSGNTVSLEQSIYTINCAMEAQKEWQLIELNEKIDLFKKFEKQLRIQQEELAICISKEIGKPIWESKQEVAAMISKIQISIDAFLERTPNKSFLNDNVKYELRHRPHGVMLVLGPFNFPGHLPNGHIIPALISGNTVIFKPSLAATASANLLLEIWSKVGLPPGVLNLIYGGQKLVKYVRIIQM